MLDFLEPLPPGPRAFPTWDEYERRLQEEKNAWERCSCLNPVWSISMHLDANSIIYSVEKHPVYGPLLQRLWRASTSSPMPPPVTSAQQITLTLPREVPTGQAELVVMVDSPAPSTRPPQTSLADWVEVQAEPNGTEQARYPLRGSVVRYERPTEPVAEDDWEALE